MSGASLVRRNGLLTGLARVVSPAGRVGLHSIVSRRYFQDQMPRPRAGGIRRQEIRAVELGRDARCWRRTGPDWRRAARRCSLFVRIQSLGVRRDVRVSAGLVCMLRGVFDVIVTALRGARSEAVGVKAKVMLVGFRTRRRRGASELLSLQRDGSNGKSRKGRQDWRDR